MHRKKFRRTSRRQASQLPRWCDIPAAWASKSTPFFLKAPLFSSPPVELTVRLWYHLRFVGALT
jgi:hypothetical protein